MRRGEAGGVGWGLFPRRFFVAVLRAGLMRSFLSKGWQSPTNERDDICGYGVVTSRFSPTSWAASYW
jgi:hypothetical protein